MPSMRKSSNSPTTSRRLLATVALCVLSASPVFGVEPIPAPRSVEKPIAASDALKPRNVQALDPRLRQFEGLPGPGSYVRAADGAIVTVQDAYCYRSEDEGRTWAQIEIPEFQTKGLKPRPENVIVRTKEGTLIFIFLDANSQQWTWDKEHNRLEGEAVLNTWAARSEDNGKTWQDLQLIQEGYNGAVRDAIVTREGAIVAALQQFLPDKHRHATVPVISTDDGLTWQTSAVLDIEGRGHHDGAFESTLTELSNGRLWLLMRTTRDCFWQSYSANGGRTWTEPTPTRIDASSAPGMLQRLDSGRLALVWNRVLPEGQTSVRRIGGQYSELEASWQRQEISLAFSDNDGESWTEPVIIARGKALAYPTLFEPRPGILWVIVPKAPLYAELQEADFVQATTPMSWPAEQTSVYPEFQKDTLKFVDPRLRPFNGLRWPGPYVHCPDGSIACFIGTIFCRSEDGGETWTRTPRPEFEAAGVKPASGNALVCTPNGVLVLLFVDENSRQWNWNKEKGVLEGEARRHVWVARSEDNGKTWQDLQKIQDGYSGAMRDAIVTSDGNVVAAMQLYLPDEVRHVTVPMISTDDGLTWRATAQLDTGGRGHHDGAFEGTLTELSDGRLWILMRTGLDAFWESYSQDGGLAWSDPTPTRIDASSSPAMLKRLDSGRLALVWNRLYPEGKTTVRRASGQFNRVAASYQRQELSLAFSDDDGTHWTEPVVIAKGRSLAYPNMFEPRPGVLWVFAPRGPLFAELDVDDYIQETTPMNWPPAE